MAKDKTTGQGEPAPIIEGYAVISEKPLRAVKAGLSEKGYEASEMRDFKSDSGYDANTLDRIKAMAVGLAETLLDEATKTELDLSKFPIFNNDNKLVVTVQIVKA